MIHVRERRWQATWPGMLLVALCLALLGACAPPAASPTPEGEPLENTVLNWHREGGLAGFCDDLVIFRGGRLVATSCKGGRQVELGSGQLTGELKEELEGWLARFEALAWEQKDEAQADAMAVRVTLVGRGSSEATPEERQAVEAFAARQFAELTAQGEGPTPTPEVFQPVPEEGRAADATRDALVALLGVDLASIRVQEVIAVDWPDSCLGLAQAGEVCAQVITPGFRIVLETGGRQYEYRTDLQSRVVRLATSPATLVEIPEAGLALSLPGDWQRQAPDWVWVPADGRDVRVGLRWADLAPPQEAEAVLLPQPAQVLASEPIELEWATGKRILLEVCGPAAVGGDTKAPVESVEVHVLWVVSQNGVRRAYDLHCAARTAEVLRAVEPVLDEVVASLKLAGAT